MPSDFPMALSSLDETNLPVVSVGLPSAARPAPAAPPVSRVVAPPRPAAKPAIEEIDLDLPVVASDLPAAKAPPPRAKAKPPDDIELDLPVVAADLPTARRGADFGDLPVVSAGLPSVAASLPSVAASLPSVAASLPSVAASLPVTAASLPVPAASLPVHAPSLPVHAPSLPVHASSLPVVLPSLPAVAGGASGSSNTGARSFGEIELPGMELGPISPKAEPARRAPPPMADDSFSFGEIDLPRETPPLAPEGAPQSLPPLFRQSVPPQWPPAVAPNANSADFGDLELNEVPRTSHPPGHAVSGSLPPVRSEGGEGGGTGFGEVDLGGAGDAGGSAAIGLDGPSVSYSEEAPLGAETRAAATAPVSIRPLAEREGPRTKGSAGKWIALGLFAVALLGGAALQLTPYGAYGYLAIGDIVHAADYQRATASAMNAAGRASAVDTYDAAKNAADSAYAAHIQTPRNRSLMAYAAFVEYEVSLRFGSDPARVARAKQLLTELDPKREVKYRDVALAAQAAEGGAVDPARAAVDAAARRDVGDPVQLSLALLRGNLELSAGDDAAALAAFKHALEFSNGPRAPVPAAQDARVHFGLARAYDGLGDGANAKKEIDATLVASPQHPGALTLRARRKSASVEPSVAMRDLTTVIEGSSRSLASPLELSQAYAAKAWIQLEHGAPSEARESFAQAVKLNQRNVEALNGEGRLLMNEGRYAEAMARFDTALGLEPNSPEAIANDAEAKIGLERLADAKQQLVAAREKFPKSLPVLLLLAKAEEHLGNKDAAEAVLRTALACVDPARSDALLPYVAMSELMSERGHLSEARDLLEEARKKLPPSATLERAFGDISELQGDYDAAVVHYKTALGRDPKDVASHFKLGVALRRMRRFDEAVAELDKVAAVDRDYPGLSLERGLLFEESGDVEKAIDQFKGALAKAPDDPDLQLRVGSAYVAIGRPEDALPMLKKALEQRPSSAEAHHYIGRALMLEGGSMLADALRNLKRAVELDPNKAEYHVYVAWAANDATPAQLELASDEVDKALALDKLNAEAYWLRGSVRRMEGQLDDAIKDEKHALELRPSRYEAHATLAECYDQKNDQAGATAEWTKAIAGDKDIATPEGSIPHPYWRYMYGKLLMDRGSSADALTVLIPAVKTAERMDPRPAWLIPLEFLSAEALRKAGRRPDAVEHYRRFLESAPVNSPDRADAQKALAQLTAGQ
jgi:tetratricopeptide (TPR) repeat protein